MAGLVLSVSPGSVLLAAAVYFLGGAGALAAMGAAALAHELGHLAAMFNLLPVLPMDGGRLALYMLRGVMSERAAEMVLRVTGTLCAMGVLATGICIRSVSAAAVGIWLGVLANFPDMR